MQINLQLESLDNLNAIYHNPSNFLLFAGKPLASIALKNLASSCSFKRLALGLSVSAWPLLQRLLYRSHVDQLALTRGAATALGSKPSDLIIGTAPEIVRNYWQQGGVLLVVGAIGAVTRIISPLLTNKEEDPAVLVLDTQASFVIPLVGGHKAGAEELAFQLAADLGGNAVVTGDSARADRLALDSFGKRLGWIRSGRKSNWHQLMLDQALGRKITFQQSSGSKVWRLADGVSTGLEEVSQEEICSSSTISIGPYTSKGLGWHPPTLWIGIGCERNTSLSLIERSLDELFKEVGLAQEAIAGLATIALKSDEKAIVSIGIAREWPIRFFSSDELSEVVVPNPSEIVQKEIGTSSVAEAASLLAAGKGGLLRQEKKIYQASSSEQGAITIAISESKEPFAPHRGEIHLVGSGPGDLALITQDARFALSRAAVWLGYDLYLDLLEPLRRKDQVRINSKLTFEKDRCLEALSLAQQGLRVALVSSGDSGIYGMAGLALEIWMKQPLADRPQFQVHPGISAFQIAAARVGAPFMNDFCAISLSDRLTPWSKIEERLIAAATGDFVVALYNPRSKDRTWQLQRAIEIFLEYRSGATPSVLARELGRPKETIKLQALEVLPVNEVDMLTLIIIGNSCTRLEGDKLVTPRGYVLENCPGANF